MNNKSLKREDNQKRVQVHPSEYSHKLEMWIKTIKLINLNNKINN